jgi:proteasome accessory factor B
MAHIPYYSDAAGAGGYRIGPHFFLPPINLTLTEALAVLMLTGRLRDSGRLPLLAHAAQAAAKVESALPATIREHVGGVLDRLHMHLGPTSRHDDLDDVFHRLAAATAERKACRLVYISFTDRKQITAIVHPLRLLFHGRAWYLIAWSCGHREIRTFKLGRIRKLTVLPRTFQRPADVDLERHFGAAWGMIPEGKLHDVHVRFHPKVAANVAEVRWHASQQTDWNDDGSLDFRVRVDGLGEIVWWILGYGDQAEVLAPGELRTRIAGVAANMVKAYRGQA